MTDKEDLLKKPTSCVDIDNDVWDTLNFVIMKALKEENEELNKKLEKLEKAFYILINHGFKIGRNISMEVDFGIAFKNCVITGQEYEMLYEALEELMKYEEL